MSHEGKRGQKKRKRGHHGVCTFCGKIHKRGRKRGDSCRGHKSEANFNN
jgi:hypothetical protein